MRFFLFCVRAVAAQDEESVELVLRAAESLTQFGEDREVQDRDGRDD
jgi:hypothetical protein